MVRICVAGACGRMGRRILELAVAEPGLEIGGAFEVSHLAGTEIIAGVECGDPQTVVASGGPVAEIAQSDVVIDFTTPTASVANACIAADAGKACVIGTTGLTEEQQAVLATCAKRIPVVYAPNMSVGVNLLFKLAKEVAGILGLDYNVEIVETHHNLKKDSPSGTAVRLAERVAEGLGIAYPDDAVFGREGIVGERPQRQIGVHAIRGGDVVGEHTVGFIGKGERIELTHKAHNRDNFARGALRAALFTQNAAPGLYDMQDVLGLK
jgi:4-hydroxy-tetrahydrodipicolinate reductase